MNPYDPLFTHLLANYPALQGDDYVTGAVFLVKQASERKMFETVYNVLIDLNDHLRNVAPAVFQDKRYLTLWHTAAQHKG